ncbi:GTPase [Neochlamydia sp. AcF65]|uniref:GTPase n=1 Tax=Neochlamydia sp. AcF65 TaxID=2795735 RepID=UPI001BCA568B|nr:GTPase [Neochlamydia sp. AcF65]
MHPTQNVYPSVPSGPSLSPPSSPQKASTCQTDIQTHFARNILENSQSPSAENLQRSGALASARAQRDVTTLLEAKLKYPSFKLSEQESLAVLMEGIRHGQNVASQAANKHIVAFIGLTGAGKSTLVNDLCGCDLLFKRPRELGFCGLSKVAAVKPHHQGGKLDEITPIRHSGYSQTTFLPQFVTNEQATYCDFPGFLEQDSYEIGIAKAVTLPTIFNTAQTLKVIILISYASLRADKAKGLTDLLYLCSHLFGSKENLLKHVSSILLGVTQLPSVESELVDDLKAFISNVGDPLDREVCSQLAQRLFIYEPLPTFPMKNAGASSREDIIQRIRHLPSIGHPSHFKVVLSPSDLQGLDTLLSIFKEKITHITSKPELSDHDFKQLATYLASLMPLNFLENQHISTLMENLQEILTAKFRHLLEEFSRLYEAEDMKSFQLLKDMDAGLRHFDSSTKKRLLKLFDDELRSSADIGLQAQLLKTTSLQYVKHSQQLMNIVLAANAEVERLGALLFTNAQQFADQTYQLSQSLHSLTDKLEEELKEGGLSANRMAQAHCLFGFARLSLQIIQDTSWQCLSLEKKAATEMGSELKETLKLAFHARKLEIDDLTKQYELVEKQKDHKWAIFMKLHAGKLKEETQLYNQLLQVEELKRQTNTAAMRQEIASWQQRNREIQAIQELSQKEQEIYQKHQQSMYCLELENIGKSIRFDVQARCQLAELLTFQLKKGGNHGGPHSTQ